MSAGRPQDPLEHPSTWVIVVAAGTGSRFGAPKQYESLAGETVLDRAVRSARSVPGCDGVVLVVADDGVHRPPPPGVGAVVAGGASRSESVRRGLAAVDSSADIVVVHDAARPLATPDLFRAVIAAVCAGADAAVPVIPVGDTIKRLTRERDRVAETLDRDELVAVQTPQAFRAGPLRAAHGGEAEATDDAALIEAAGGTVVVVPGEATNLKITRPSDLAVAEALLAWRARP